MCGIAGIGFVRTSELSAIAANMAARLSHRGPDDQGGWCDEVVGVALAHRRLSIIDLSQAGHQPMHSASGRYVISYNGEIYNFQELRARLDYPWCGHSDTEVILAAIEAWGIEKALQSFNGMFAFALWDRQERTLTLARDRMGEKPLYYGEWQGEVVFASELKAFKALPDFNPAINREALLQYMRYSYIPAPLSIYQGIHKLEPGQYITFVEGGLQAEPKAYWSLSECIDQARHQPFTGSEGEAIETLEKELSQAVGRRMISDVPLGAFLSGGIDSSAVTLLMQRQSAQPVKTFSIGFAEMGFDEAPHAKAIAAHLGTEHTELYVSPQQAREVIPKLAQIYDEPFADSSQIPTYLVAAMARDKVTVALSGDGGDELLGGYNRHVSAPRIWQAVRWMPPALRGAAARMLASVSGQSSRHWQKALQAMGADNEAAFYRSLCSQWQQPDSLVIGAREILNQSTLDRPFAEWMMQQDMLTYLPGDILTKVDRASMAVGLETRIPFLDPELIRFAWQLPQAMKIRERQGKWILRQMLYRHIPSGLLDRPKAGFSLPLAAWLRGELRDWAESLLDESRLRQQGYLQSEPIFAAWKQLLAGNDYLEAKVWNVLMLQSWLDRMQPHDGNE